MMPAERRRVVDEVAAARARAIESGAWPAATPPARRQPGQAPGLVRGPYAPRDRPLLRPGRCRSCRSVWCETESFASTPCPFCGEPR